MHLTAGSMCVSCGKAGYVEANMEDVWLGRLTCPVCKHQVNMGIPEAMGYYELMVQMVHGRGIFFEWAPNEHNAIERLKEKLHKEPLCDILQVALLTPEPCPKCSGWFNACDACDGGGWLWHRQIIFKEGAPDEDC